MFRRKFHGLKIKKSDAERLVLDIGGDISKLNISEFLTSLPSKYQLSFFDDSYPQISDPGAYVWAQRLTNDKFAYSLHNAGWSSEWKAISQEELVEYIDSVRNRKASGLEIFPYRIKAELGKMIGRY